MSIIFLWYDTFGKNHEQIFNRCQCLWFNASRKYQRFYFSITGFHWEYNCYPDYHSCIWRSYHPFFYNFYILWSVSRVLSNIIFVENKKYIYIGNIGTTHIIGGHLYLYPVVYCHKLHRLSYLLSCIIAAPFHSKYLQKNE